MRNMLLASVFVLGASGAALAQNADQPTAAANVFSGQVLSRPGQTPLTNNNNNAYGTARKGVAAVPTPGTVVVRLNFRVMTQFFQGWNSLMNSGAPGTNTSSTGMGGWARLYPGIDAMAANGMRYGAAIELRTNLGATGNIASTPSISNPASGASGSTNVQTIYLRRAFAYFGTDQLGIVRVGMGDGLISLMDQGRTTNQGYSPTSNFNGSDLQVAIGGNSAPPFVFLSGSGDEYDTQKFVYLSPNFSGFDFGLQYSPQAFNSLQGCTVPATACANLSSSLVPGDGARYRNMVAAGVRYLGKVGPVDMIAYGVYSYAGHVNNNLSPAASRTAVLAPGGSSWDGQFDNLSFGSAGVAVTYQGLTLAANYIGGAVNGRMAAKPSSGSTMNAFLVGFTYRNGPFAFGSSFANIDEQGSVAMTGLTQRHEYEFAIGGSYAIAPGMVMFADYLYQNRKQGGFNFATNTPGAANNQVQGQGFVLGTMVTW
ncbi:MAG: hypothetical protein AB7O80_08045 [Acetobacteraceae bacterium]